MRPETSCHRQSGGAPNYGPAPPPPGGKSPPHVRSSCQGYQSALGALAGESPYTTASAKKVAQRIPPPWPPPSEQFYRGRLKPCLYPPTSAAGNANRHGSRIGFDTVGNDSRSTTSILAAGPWTLQETMSPRVDPARAILLTDCRPQLIELRDSVPGRHLRPHRVAWNRTYSALDFPVLGGAKRPVRPRDCVGHLRRGTALGNAHCHLRGKAITYRVPKCSGSQVTSTAIVSHVQPGSFTTL
jgi:hypothetical protein